MQTFTEIDCVNPSLCFRHKDAVKCNKDESEEETQGGGCLQLHGLGRCGSSSGWTCQHMIRRKGRIWMTPWNEKDPDLWVFSQELGEYGGVESVINQFIKVLNETTISYRCAWVTHFSTKNAVSKPNPYFKALPLATYINFILAGIKWRKLFTNGAAGLEVGGSTSAGGIAYGATLADLQRDYLFLKGEDIKGCPVVCRQTDRQRRSLRGIKQDRFR